jgi:hypothetical protein
MDAASSLRDAPACQTHRTSPFGPQQRRSNAATRKVPDYGQFARSLVKIKVKEPLRGRRSRCRDGFESSGRVEKAGTRDRAYWGYLLRENFGLQLQRRPCVLLNDRYASITTKFRVAAKDREWAQ